MESSHENREDGTLPKIIHSSFKSGEHNISYEIFWSEKFIDGLKSFSDEDFANILTQIKELSNNKVENKQIPKD